MQEEIRMAIDLKKIKQVVIKKEFKMPIFNDSDDDVKEYDDDFDDAGWHIMRVNMQKN